MKPVADEAVAESPSVEHVVVLERLGADVAMTEGRDLTWDELRARGLDGGAGRHRVRGHRVRGRADDRLHVRHHRPAEGGGPRARRLPGQDGLRGLLPGRPAPGRDPLLGHRHGLDHGPVGDGRRGLHRRDGGDVRGSARLARARPRVGVGRAPPRERAGGVADADPGAAHRRRRAPGKARPLEPARVRVDRGAVEPGAVQVAVRGGRRRPRADHQHLRRHRGRRVLPDALSRRGAEGVLARGRLARHGRRRVRSGREPGARRGGGAGLQAAVARNDARHLGRQPSATWRRTGRCTRTSGATATGR